MTRIRFAHSELERLRRALVEVYEAGGMTPVEARQKVDGSIDGAVKRFRNEDGGEVTVDAMEEVLTHCLTSIGCGQFREPEWTTPANALFKASEKYTEAQDRKQRIRERL